MKKRTLIVSLAAALILAAPFVAVAQQEDWNAGLAAFKQGNLGSAAAEFQKVVDTQPDWDGGHYMLGWTYLKQGKHREAITHLRKAYDLKKENLAYQLRLGEAYVASGRNSDAVGFLSNIDAAKLPKDQQAFHAQLLAVALTKTGQTDQALSAFAKAAAANPNDAQVQFQYGTAAYNSGDTATAVRALSRAAQLDGKDIDKKIAYTKALNRSGRESPNSSTKLSAYRKAAETAQQVVAAQSTYDNVMLLGEAHLGAKQYDQAIAAFEQAAKKNSNDWLSHFYIGQAYTAKQQYRSADASLKNALNKTASAANQKRIWKQLGFVYEKQKKYDDAILAYQKADDQAGAQRAQENRDTAEYNRQVEQENEQIRKIKEQQDEIKKQLQELPGGPPPR